MPGLDQPDPASERVLVDPNVLDTSGGTAIDFFVPSVDGDGDGKRDRVHLTITRPKAGFAVASIG